MRFKFLLAALSLLVFAATAWGEEVNVDFCIDGDMDGLCDEEFTTYLEPDGLTDMDILEIAFEDELFIDDWDDYLWAVSIEGYDYDLLPQFDGPEDVYLAEGDEVYIWFTGWIWYSSSEEGSPSQDPTESGGAQGSGSGPGWGSDSGSSSGGGAGSSTGPVPSGSAEVTTVSSQYKGYTVVVDGVQIGTEGTGSDVPDGRYTFYVAGNQQHTIRLTHPVFYYKNWYGYTYWTDSRYIINVDVQGDPRLMG
jgi:hypothetical protein